MKYLLDTNICIYIINERPVQVLQRLIDAGQSSLALSTVTVAELAFGIEKSNRADSLPKLENFLSKFPLLPWDKNAAWAYGKVRKSLEASGRRIGERDLLLASQALASNLTIVTNNTREFERVEGLKLENWV